MHSKPGIATGESGDRINVFISYSRRDVVSADALVTALEVRGFDVAIDRRDLPYGEEWQVELGDFIRASDTVVWLVSPDSVTSKWCNWELGEVRQLNKRLIPVRIRELELSTLPESIGKLHLLPAEGVYDPQSHVEALVQVLNTDRTWVKEATRLADRARQWIVRARDPGVLLRGTALQDAEQWSRRRPAASPPPSQEVLDLILTSRQAATKRGRYWLAGTATLLLFTTGGGLWAWTQKLEADLRRHEASQQRTVAERNFNFSIDATERLAVGLAQDLREATGMRMDRVKGILDRAETLYETLTRSTGSNQRLLRSQVWMLKESALTYQRLGDSKSSRDRIDRSVSAARRLASLGTPEREADSNLAELLSSQADIAHIQGDEVVTQASLEEASQLLRKHAIDRLGKKRLMFVLSNVGLTLAATAPATARAALEERARLAQQVTVEAQMDLESTKSFAEALHDLGWLSWADNDMPAARKTFEKVAETWRVIIKVAPDNLEVKHSFLRTLQRLADVSGLMGDKTAALRANQEGLALTRQLAKARPDSYQAQVDVCFALARVATLKIDAKEMEGVWDDIDEALVAARRFSQQDQSDATATEQLGNTLLWIGQDLHRLGDKDRAYQSLRDSVAIKRKLASVSPGEARSQSGLAFGLGAAADILPRVEAIEGLKESIALLEPLIQDGRISSSFRQTLDSYRTRLSNMSD